MGTKEVTFDEYWGLHVSGESLNSSETDLYYMLTNWDLKKKNLKLLKKKERPGLTIKGNQEVQASHSQIASYLDT